MPRRNLWFTKSGEKALDEIIQKTGWDNISGVVREALVLTNAKLDEQSEEGYELRKKIQGLKLAEEARG